MFVAAKAFGGETSATILGMCGWELLNVGGRDGS